MRSSANQLIALELHWGLAAGDAYWYAVPVEWFWEQTEHWCPETRYQLALPENGLLQVLTPAAQLLHLAAHAMLQHGGGRIVLRWVYDMDRLIRARSADLDWQVLCSRAREFRWTPALFAALSRAQACFDTPVPDGLMQTLEKDGDRRVLSLVERKAHFPGTRASSTWRALASLNWPARLRLAAAFIFPAPTYVRWRYNPRPAWSWPVYYLYRWLDMLGDGIVTLGKAPRPPNFGGSRPPG